ncbi:putative Mechanosensitive ion channel family protein [uncultured Woeseiaceae bacterium]|uniref:Putative Mechanosensitive ion channel family protein n=1 Tax=uncultured Woeseiaceae bacterium TaxID=1983305 RepID=A0A7D9H3U1_9GAMM|nr:putative Mechanosensitive ion channel family protein [uncultured Woeseiaceae bacterium]
MKNNKLFRLLLVTLLLAGAQASAQDDSVPAMDGPIIPADEFDRGTPRRSAEGFLAAVDEADYETAAEYLDLRNLRGAASELTGAQLARRLFVIVKRGSWVDIDELLDHPAGRSNDNLPDYRDSMGVVLDGDKEVRLLMQKVPRGDGVSIWKISNATVSLIPKLYATYGYPEGIEDLRRSLPNVAFLGFELFKWVIVFAVAIFAYAAVFLVALAIRRVLGDPDTPTHQRVFRFLAQPAGIWVVVMSMSTVATSLGRGVTAETMARLSPVPILVTVWMLFGGMNLLRDIYSNRLQERERPGAAVLLGPAANALKLLIGIGAILIYLDKLGINITTVLAGLGVGGIAVALALQKPMEDVFGAFTLYTQQPVRVGDFCRVGTEMGTIEEIGLRTTRLRTLANTLIAIPNSRLANEPIDNISARSKILYRPVLRLRYDTTPEQLQQILDGVRKLFSAHEQVLQDNHRVRFKEIADDALLVEVYAYLDTTDWSEYLELAEGLNMQILEIVAQANTTLSLPARTLHIEQSDGSGKAAIA